MLKEITRWSPGYAYKIHRANKRRATLEDIQSLQQKSLLKLYNLYGCVTWQSVMMSLAECTWLLKQAYMCIDHSIISATKEHMYSFDSDDVGRLRFVVTFI